MITVKDLAKLTDKTRKGEFLYCRICGSRYSATAGDYFWKASESEFICCGELLILAYESRKIIIVKE